MKYLLNCRSLISLMILFSFSDNFGMEKYDFRVVFVGDAGVGKTQIITKFVKNEFLNEYKTTLSACFYSKFICWKNKKVNLQLGDTSGQEKYRSITKIFCKASQLIVLVYAINDKKSFENIQNWVNDVRNINEDAKFLLVGNKCDLEERKEVPTEVAKNYAKENKMEFIEVSAKDGTNIDKNMFNPSLSKLLEEYLLLDNQYIDGIKFNKTSCWSEYCSCCPCL